MTSGNGRSITWSSFNKPILISKGSTSVGFSYDPDRARYRQVKSVDGDTTTTVYIDKLYEQVTHGGQKEDRHYIVAGGNIVAIRTEKTGLATTTHYMHYDHLGSVDVVTDENASVIERSSFSPFGMRRNAGNWNDATGFLTSEFTTRGFTGHEQLDEVGLVHMNGRVYDPLLGRFLSADPQVQFPKASQSFNRYSYVHNNPLSYTDPSGYGLFSKIKNAFKKVGSAIKNALKSPIVRAIVAIAASYYTLGYVSILTGNALFGAAASGFLGGYIGTGSLKGAAIGAVTAAAFYGVGAAFQQFAKGGWDKGVLYFGKVVAHGTVGGLSSHVQGGSFADGFRSAGFTQFSAPVVGGVSSGALGRVVAAAVVGGAASKLGGGKFANGARTFGFLRLFGEIADYATQQTDELKRLACSSGGRTCAYDGRGVLRTDGGRDIDWSRNPDHDGNWLTRSGMAPEGGAHVYENNTLARNFIVNVSKVHDWFNSWNYNQSNGFYMSRGVGFDSGFQIYSFAGMPVAALATVGGYAGNAPFEQQWLNYSLSRRKDE